MIRKNELFCKLIRIKKSSYFLFGDFSRDFVPHQESCPSCHSKGNCSYHASYQRSLIDFVGGHPSYRTITVTRLICKSCGHTHAVLPDFIIPYAQYGLFFILRVLAEYFAGILPVMALCSRFSITHSMLGRWLSLFQNHKDVFLGVLESAEVSPLAFVKRILFQEDYSTFGSAFFKVASFSFLQNHATPAAL